MLRDQSTISIIGERYLDTTHDAAYVEELEAELAARGVVGLRRTGYEYIAAGALWWNFLWMDWIHLDDRDVRVGWISNAFVFGLIALFTGYYLGLTAAMISLVVMHITTLCMGLLGRAGSLPSKKREHKKP